MFSRLFGHAKRRAQATRLYDACVVQARRPEFYTRLGVADTVDGRFDMVALHVSLLLRRLERSGDPAHGRLAEAVMEAMFLDMDRALREMGVGDLSVGKKVRGMGEAFVGRARAYDMALREGDRSGLEAALSRNLYRKSEPTPAQLRAMADYVETMDRDLAALEDATIDGPEFLMATAVPDME